MSTDPGKKLDTVPRRQGEWRRPGQSDVPMIASAGDGQGIALALASLAAGFTLLVVGRSLQRLQQRMTTLAGAGDRLACHQADLRDPFAVDALSKQVNALHGVPDLVVFNAGDRYRKPFTRTACRQHRVRWSYRHAATHECFPDLRTSTMEDGLMLTSEIAQTYLSMHHQPRNASSHDIDLRP